MEFNLDDINDPPLSVKAPVRRTTNYTVQEDLMIAQAYIAASEDSITGNYQKGSVFYVTMGGIYKDLCIEHCKNKHNSLVNSENNSRRTNPLLKAPPVYVAGTNTFSIRTGEAIFKRFKATIAKACTTMVGLMTTWPLKSGEDESQYWGRMLAAYVTKTGTTFKFTKAFLFLKDSPKWEAFCQDAKADDEKHPVRPRVSKSAKRIADDKVRTERAVDKVMGVNATTHRVGKNNDNFQPDPTIAGMQNILEASFTKIAHMLAVQDMSPDGKAEDRANRRAAAKLALEARELANQEKKIALAERQAALLRDSRSPALSTTASSACRPPRTIAMFDSDSDNPTDESPIDEIPYKNAD